MKLTRALFPMTAVLLIVVVAMATMRVTRADAAAGPEAKEKADSKKASSPSKPAADRPATIQGKTIDEWLAALKDRDPAVRERAVEVLGERSLDPAVPADEQSRLQTRGELPPVLGQGPGGSAGRRVLRGSPEDLPVHPRG